MKKIVRLTEADLTRIVRRVLKEQEGEKKETGGDTDWWSLVLKPKLKAAGFVETVNPAIPGKPCYYKCCNYMFKGTHEEGTNVFLDCGEGGDWKIVVYNKGNQNMKKFQPGEMGASQAVKYALSLK